MKFCPFAQRVRLVLLVKNIPHDIVNVDLKNKPEWLFTMQPEGTRCIRKIILLPQQIFLLF